MAAELRLKGYLTTGKFNVNDYTIKIERVSNGLRIRVLNGDDVQEAYIYDGEFMKEAELKKIREEFEKKAQEIHTYGEGISALVDDLAYKDGDKIAFDGSADGTVDGVSPFMNAAGYSIDNNKRYIKINVGKSLRKIRSVTCDSFFVSMSSDDYTSYDTDRLSAIERIVIDHVQNCIHVVLMNDSYIGYNVPLICEAGKRSASNPAVKFTMHE